MAKLSKAKQESLDRLNDQLIIAKENGNTRAVKLLEKIIKRVQGMPDNVTNTSNRVSKKSKSSTK